jgi:hypothetical protein
MSLPTEVADKLHHELRRYMPATIRAYVPDADEPRVMKPTGKRNRWRRVVDSMPGNAERVELLDSKGNVLAAFDLADDDESNTPTKGKVGEVGALLQLVNSGIDRAIERLEKRDNGITEGYRTLVDTAFKRLAELEGMLAEMVRVVYEAHVLAGKAAAAATGGEQDPGKEAFDTVMEMAGLKKQRKQPSAAPTNGAGK